MSLTPRLFLDILYEHLLSKKCSGRGHVRTRAHTHTQRNTGTHCLLAKICDCVKVEWWASCCVHFYEVADHLWACSGALPHELLFRHHVLLCQQ